MGDVREVVCKVETAYLLLTFVRGRCHQAVPLFEQLLDECVEEVCCKGVDVHGEGLTLGDPVHLFEEAAEFTVD